MTSGNSTYQPGDEDFRLAAFLGQIAEGEPEAGAPDDPLLPLLEEYKASANLRYSAFTGEQAWHDLNAAMKKKNGGARIFRIPAAAYKAAAVLLAAALLILGYLLMQPDTPELLAESGTEITVVELEERAFATMRPNSRLYRIELSSDRQVYRISGEVYFDVNPDRTREFTVFAGEARVDVTGTRFNLSSWGEAVRVFVESGSVRFTAAGLTESADLQAGRFSEYSGGTITEPMPSGDMRFTAWLENVLFMESRTFASVTGEVEHHFGVTIVLPEAFEGELLSGSLPLINLEELLNDLALSMNGEFVETADGVFEFVPEQR
jgi:ferric-dicitrate binding protein FerR (iron transport regulator)